MLIEATQLYEVTFESNGGTSIKSYRTNCIEKSPAVTKEDVFFSGWYETADFRGERVQFPYYLKENKTLYARWIKISHVKFETNGGSEVSEMDTSIINSAPESSKKGYILLGWYKESKLQNQISFPYVVTDDTVLYAKWIADTNTLYKVEHYKQNTAFETNLNSYIFCDSETKSGKTNALTQAAAKNYSGFTAKDFKQVSIAADGSTVVKIYYDRNKYIVNYKVRHYKQKTVLGNNYELAEEETLYGNAGESTLASAKVFYGFTEKSFSQSIISESGNTVVNIYYDRNKYTVTFNANSGTGSMVKEIFYYGVKQNLFSSSFSKTGYIFNGWSDSATGSIQYQNNESILIENNKTLYAIWFYGTTVSAVDISNLDLTKLTADYTVRVSGQISHSTLEELAKKIALAKVNITLDLSETQGLTTISPDSSNKSIFSNCKKLTSIILPDSLSTIGSNAFSCCQSLTKLSILSSVKTIGSYAFSYCENLKEIKLDGVDTIGAYAFYNCKNMTIATIKNVKTVGNYAFNYCSNLSEVIFENIETIGNYCFGSSLNSDYSGNCKKLSSVKLKNIGTIKRYAFARDLSLSSVEMQNVTSIEESAFAFCIALTSIKIDAETIGRSAFEGCSVLTSVIIGKRVTEIQNYSSSNLTYYVFKNCSALTSVAFEDVTNWYVKHSDTYSYNIDVSVVATNAVNLQYSDKPWIKK
jgi:uncharacterized repeat protein (TIGR02543 family)